MVASALVVGNACFDFLLNRLVGLTCVITERKLCVGNIGSPRLAGVFDRLSVSMRCELSVRCVTEFVSKRDGVLVLTSLDCLGVVRKGSNDEWTAVGDQAIKGSWVLEAEFESVPLCVSE